MVLDSGSPVHGVEAEASLLLQGKEERIWLDLNADPIIIDGKKCVILAINNITERKKREDEFNRLNRTLKALSDNSHAIMHSKDEEEYLEKVCNIIINDCGHHMAWIGFAENNKSKSVRPVAQAGFEEGYLKSLKITWADTELGHGPTGMAIRTGKPCLCENILADPNFKPWREEALKRGYRSSIVLPLLNDNKVLGTINIYSDRPNPFLADEIKLLVKLADDVVYGIKFIGLRILEKQAKEVLKRDKETFEALVGEKTAELVNMHVQMERTKRLSGIGTLAATVAHELRNPLAAIALAIANIKRKAGGPLLEKHITNIEKKIGESDNIISNLLFYSRIKPPQYESVNINNIIEECVEHVSEQYKSKEISLGIKIDKTKDILIKADPIQIKEVFSNILNNAADALPESGGKIEISAENKEGSIELSIKDNGIGIDKEHLDKIFEPFFTTKAKGTGLGLSVCKQVIELHDGIIKIESHPGKGTQVKIVLPKK
ncbi:MAG: ATP-binding protein, partial [Candidatus Omnitrophota bacterium]|jgi:signal transduction histidine kinase